MDKEALKKNILEKSRAIKEKSIADLKTRIYEIKEGDANINEDQYELDRQGFDQMENDQISRLGTQVNIELLELKNLNKIRIEKPLPDTVDFGSIVVTDKETFFVAVSLEAFDVDGRHVYGLSDRAPIFFKMKGKKAGDSFTYNDTTYQIKDVY